MNLNENVKNYQYGVGRRIQKDSAYSETSSTSCKFLFPLLLLLPSSRQSQSSSTERWSCNTLRGVNAISRPHTLLPGPMTCYVVSRNREGTYPPRHITSVTTPPRESYIIYSKTAAINYHFNRLSSILGALFILRHWSTI